MLERMKRLGRTRLGRIAAFMVRGYTDHEVMVYAGNATLRILMSCLPLMMLVLAVVNLLPFYSAESFALELVHFLPDIPEIQGTVRGILIKLNLQSSGTVISLAAITTLWTASGAVFSIQKALAGVTADARTTPWDRGLAVLYTVFFLLLIIAVLLVEVLGSSILGAAGALTETLGIPNLFALIQRILDVSRVVLLGAMFLFLLLMYRFLPGGRRSWRAQAPGALFTTVLWVAFSGLFAYAIPRFWKASSIYGSMAAVFLVALWLQYLILILMLGGIFNQALLETSSKPDPLQKE